MKKSRILKAVKKKFDTFDLISLKEKKLQYDVYSQRMVDIQSNIDDIDKEIEHKQTHLDGIGSLTFDDGCEHCVQNKNTPFAQQAQSLETEIGELNLTRTTRIGELEDASFGKAKYDVTSVLNEVEGINTEIKDYESKIDRLELQSKSCNLELTQLKNGIKKVEIKKDNQKKIDMSLKSNRNIDFSIPTYQEMINELFHYYNQNENNYNYQI